MFMDFWETLSVDVIICIFYSRMARNVRSPLEHGELEASPFNHSPDIEIGVPTDSHDEEYNEDDSPRYLKPQ